MKYTEVGGPGRKKKFCLRIFFKRTSRQANNKSEVNEKSMHSIMSFRIAKLPFFLMSSSKRFRF